MAVPVGMPTAPAGLIPVAQIGATPQNALLLNAGGENVSPNEFYHGIHNTPPPAPTPMGVPGAPATHNPTPSGPPAPLQPPHAPTPTPTPTPTPSPHPAGPPAPLIPPTPAPPPVPPRSAPAETPSSTAPALTGPGGQIAPSIGAPEGYSLGQGVDTSYSGLLPQGFTVGSLQGTPIPDANLPGDAIYEQQAQENQVGPTSWDVTAPMTVAGQYSDLMSQGNPAIQAAEQATLRAHAASGGANDLMAQTAATQSGSQVALQIAAQDAATYASAGQFNASAANDFAKQLNSFTDNMLASRQNFDQGVAMLHDQTNANIEQLYSQIQGSAATESINLKGQLQTAQINMNATMEQMDKTFSQNVAMAGLQEQFTNENAWEQYGMQVRGAYLSSVNTQQTALMQTIAAINSNPNINSTQAAAGIQSAVSQFNSFMTMNNAYYASMVPGSTTLDYSTYDPNSWPNEVLAG